MKAAYGKIPFHIEINVAWRYSNKINDFVCMGTVLTKILTSVVLTKNPFNIISNIDLLT